MNNYKNIAERLVPPVTGIDLEHALNYVSADGLPLKWFYTSFTYPRAFYRAGSRPLIEAALAGHCPPGASALTTLRGCLVALSKRVQHHSLLETAGARDCGTSEEHILNSGRGWCNEQARVLAAFTQIAGLPSRLVFAGTAAGHGHVLTEVYADGQWILVDQSVGHIFTRADGVPVNVWNFKSDPVVWRETDTGYRVALRTQRQGAANLEHYDHWVPYATLDHPLELFTELGYCNYFIH